MKIFFRYILILSVLFSFIDCARKGNPRGGEKDETPPKLVRSFPENKSLNFKGKEIKLVFDEYIKLKDIRKNLLISPPPRQMPKISPTGFASKEIVIEFEKDLQENTTYLINFGESIVDNNEGNKYGNFQFVFSTGAEIDTLKLAGKEYSLHFKKEPKNVFIGLYPHEQFRDSSVFKISPYYVAKVQKNGSFNFTHLKKGTYDVIVLADENGNYVYNPKTEAIGFLDKSIEIPRDSVISIDLFREKMPFSFDVIKQRSANHAEIRYKGESQNFEVIEKMPVEQKLGFHQRHAYHFWYKSASDSVKLKVKNIGFEKEYDKKRKKNKDSLFLRFNKNGTIHILDTLRLGATIPIINVDKNRIKILENDSLEVSFDARQNKQYQLNLFFDRRLGQSYKVLVFPDAITDFFGNKNKDTLQADLKLKSAEVYGNLKLVIKNIKQRNIFVELLNSSGKIVRKSVTQTSEKFDFMVLSPDKYSIRVIFDENKNNIWDTGDYMKHQFPEKIVNFTAKLEVRANWDINQSLRLP